MSDKSPGGQFRLLKTRRFMPLFVTQFLGAMNDNLFKQALLVLFTFSLAAQLSIDSGVLVNIANGLFILPFALFSATAGQIADKFEKGRIIRLIKLAEIGIMALAAWALYLRDPVFLIGVLFLMGTQSTFFGPLKYSILPDHLRDDELIGGNALIEGATFLAILIGTIAGTLIILGAGGIERASVALLAVAVLGYAASRAIPKALPPAPELVINWNIAQETWRIVKTAASQRRVFLAILGVSWFWLVGATFLAQFPSFTRDVVGGDQTVLNLFLVVFSLGIGAGSLWCNRLLASEISAKFVPLGALGISLFTGDLIWAAHGLSAPGAQLQGVVAFVVAPAHWRILFDLLAISVCGGIFTVPLYAIIQHDSEAASRARTIAANNIVNALFIATGAAAAASALAAGFSILNLFAVLALLNLLVAAYIVRLLPEAIVRAGLVAVLRLLYRVEVKGLDHYARASSRAVIIVNHVSFLDGLLLATFLPRKPIFAINTQIARLWWMRPLIALAEAFPLDPTNPFAIKDLIRKVEENRHCVIFPEGRITVTGGLMKVFEGPGMIADKTGADLVPIRIDGAQYTRFSRLGGILRRQWFPKITITILEPQKFQLPEGTSGKVRRQHAAAALYDVMADMMFATTNLDQTLFEALLDARSVHGSRQLVIEDPDRKPLTYNRLVLGARVLGVKIAAITARGDNVGILLPNASATAVTFFALQAQGRVPAMLNFSAGVRNMSFAIKASGVKTVLSSRKFVALAELGDVVTKLQDDARFVYLEDLRETISWRDKLAGILNIGNARPQPGDADKPAVVLFTSGSEGTPKGVALSHRNLMANRHQLAARVDFNATDIVFNALPVFHAFGLTGGLLLPILSGIRTFLYPSPLHYRIVPALVYETNATIVFGTDTFLSGYGRVADPYDFRSVRYVFAGAEKVKTETRATWADKFGIRILEGYGATETAPVLAVNTPMHFRAGTVGRFLPGIAHELVPVPGVDRGGRLMVSGPNVMLGYFRHENPGVLEVAKDRYDTGDIVDIDNLGFVTILGRAKRFAKIGGEMISLAAVEDLCAAVWPDHAHAVISAASARKGEQLVLLTEFENPQRDTLLSHAREQGVPELMIPRLIHPVKTLPLLGTGKIDYPAVQELLGAMEGKQ